MMSSLSLLAIVASLTAPQDSATRSPADVPWQVGERLEYQVKFGPLSVGTGSMEVTGIVPIRGRDAWQTEFRIKGKALWYDYASTLRTWMDVTELSSLRFHSEQNEDGRPRVRNYEIFPDRKVYIQQTATDSTTETPSVADPLDDGSFMYFIRTVPLEVGKTYEFNRYFRPDRNPVTIKVLRKESVKVPAGRFDAIVIQPIIKSGGIFKEGGNALIWLRDDPSRIMLQMKSTLSFGSINLYLKSHRPAAGN